MSKISFRPIWLLAITAFVRWLANPRIIVLFILVAVIKALAADPLLIRAAKMGVQPGMLETFIAIVNASTLLMFIPGFYLLLVSDFPVICGHTLFAVKRSGKYNWFLGQMLFALLSIVFYMAFIFAVSLLLGGGAPDTQWSVAVTLYDIHYPGEYMNYAWFLVPPNLYNQMTVITAAVQSALLVSLYLLLLALLLCLFKMLYMRTAGLLATFAVVAAGVATVSIEHPVMWAFPMANSIVWLHYDQVLREPVSPVASSFVYFAVAIAAALTANFIALRKLQFTNLE